MTYPKVIDVSWCQAGNMNWARLRELGIGVIMRCGQDNFEDSSFRVFWNAAWVAKVPAGVYFFYQPDIGAARQIVNFLKIYDSLTVKPKAIFLDVEDIYVGGGKPNIVPPSIAFNTVGIRSWLDAVEKATGIVPGIYTRANYWNAWVTRSADWEHYPLWIATWTQYSANVVMPLDWDKWLFWQYEGGTGRQDGVTGPVDLDFYNGTQAEMEAYFGAAPTPPPPPIPVPDPAAYTLETARAEIGMLKARVEALEVWRKTAFNTFVPVVTKP